ncbi:uncharacterized protein STEHIDRAFT_160309 [Stereum hirsutum FP-91666 SS1]|uniref:uncharacterized protein n=1 Tax=Stereum hirsutum (strain FP-91666) TaxID=721885 RepID=UPI000444A65D|nr:uncharacterized protein STEHIDRAFT_160309 [Stereum hirsutum FP-91666 SS1]EIM82677.1 hypothetical protein STEHIDRAFT_160309 [Stereum hirsutum FP-91666 SS1]
MFSRLVSIPTFFSALSLFTATAALNVPRQSSTNPCSAFPGAGSLNALNFMLAALNTTLPNANTTGASVILAGAGAIDGAEFYGLVTQASYPYPPTYPLFNMTNGGLPAAPLVWGTEVSSGAVPGFLSTSLETPNPAEIYCSVTVDGYEHPTLAVNGRTDPFSVCREYPCESTPWEAVYYNATNGSSTCGASPACYPVVLSIVFA